jgi:hypothetical protein
MKFIWEEDNCKIVFTKEEAKLINDKGKVTINYDDGRHFVNGLARIVAEIHKKYLKLDPKFQDKNSFDNSEVKLK